jgi:hypothetical protein
MDTYLLVSVALSQLKFISFERILKGEEDKMQRFWSFLIIFLVIISVVTLSFGQIKTQQAGKQPTPLQPLMSVLNVEASFADLKWNLAIGYGEPENKPKLYEEFNEDFDDWLQRKPQVDERKGQIAEYNLAFKYKENIKKVFENFGLIGSELGMFLYSENEIPIRFAQIENELVFLVTRVGSNKVYNTLRSTSKNRAAKIISSNILPELKAFYDSFKNTDIKYYGMIVAYGGKDFLNKSTALNLKTEVVAFIVSSENCKKFSEGIITEDELVDLSDIYLKDRDMVTDIKKIKVALE